MKILTKDFTVEELCVTDTGAVNVPDDNQREKLMYLASYLLQPIRDRFGKIKINSGFRSQFVNEKVGGSPTSQHLKGEAADFYPLQADIDAVFEWCRKNLIFGQLINEHKNGKRWIHISLPRIGGMNMQIMEYKDGVYKNLP